MSESDRQVMACAFRTIEEQIDRTPFGEVGISFVVHDGRVRRIDLHRSQKLANDGSGVCETQVEKQQFGEKTAIGGEHGRR